MEVFNQSFAVEVLESLFLKHIKVITIDYLFSFLTQIPIWHFENDSNKCNFNTQILGMCRDLKPNLSFSLLNRESWHGDVQHCGFKCIRHALSWPALVHQDCICGHQQPCRGQQHWTVLHFLHTPPFNRLPFCRRSCERVEIGLEAGNCFPHLLHPLCHSVHPVWAGDYWQ